MKLAFYQILHVASMVLLTAAVFRGFANPDPLTRRRTLALVGILSLAMLIGGFGLVAVTKAGFPWWILVKLVCWLGLSSLSGLGYRKPALIPKLSWVATFLVLIAVASVYGRHVLGGGYE